MVVPVVIGRRQFDAGHVFTDMPAMSSEPLVANGFAEYVTAPILDSPVNRMMQAEPVKRKRGRPIGSKTRKPSL